MSKKKSKLQDLDVVVAGLHDITSGNTRHSVEGRAIAISHARGVIMRVTDAQGRGVVFEYLISKGWIPKSKSRMDDGEMHWDQWYDLIWSPMARLDDSHLSTCPCLKCSRRRDRETTQSARSRRRPYSLDIQVTRDIPDPIAQSDEDVYTIHQAGLDKKKGQTCACPACEKFTNKVEEKQEEEKREEKALDRFAFLEFD